MGMEEALEGEAEGRSPLTTSHVTSHKWDNCQFRLAMRQRRGRNVQVFHSSKNFPLQREQPKVQDLFTATPGKHSMESFAFGVKKVFVIDIFRPSIFHRVDPAAGRQRVLAQGGLHPQLHGVNTRGASLADRGLQA